jgi:hypothetical protein
MRQLILSIFLLVSSITYCQNIINVNNTASGVTTQYTTLAAAVAGATIGDIIYLYPSSTSYGNATINKKLTIIGPGYNVAQNQSLQISSYTSNGIVDHLTFAVGSNGSLITGVDVVGAIIMNGQANIAITRCRLRANVILDNTNNILFEGCYLEFNGNAHKINANTFCNSLVIRNNIFNATHGSTGNYDIVIQANCNAIVENNVFRWTNFYHNTIARNNIYLYNSASGIVNNGTSNSFLNNVLVANHTGLGSTNIINVPEANIFQGWPTQGSFTFDDRYKLKAGSPAIGAGVGGVDCGAFGGATPYKLSGIPFVPLVYQINAPTSGSASTGISVNVKVRASN